MVQRRFRILIAVLTIIVLTAGLLTTAKAQNPQALNIGVIGPFDGPTAQGVSLAIERINGQGPITGPNGVTYAVSVIAADAQTPDEVTTALSQLKQNNVVAIFGPDDDRLAAASLSALSSAGVPVFLGATSTAIKTGGTIFRTRAADNYQMNALADIMLTDLAKNKFAIYQGNDAAASPVGELVGVLTQRGKPPSPPVIQVANGAIADSAKVLTDSQPDAIIAFGDSAQLAELYRTLRGSNFTGVFATPITDSRAFIRSIPVQLRSGIYGVTTWPYSWDAPVSSDFTRDYVAMFGEVPTPLSAAAYDSAVALVIAIKDAGTAPDALQNRILSLSRSTDAIQGTFDPKLGNNALSASVAVIVTGRYGAPTIVARYDETGRLPNVTTPPTAIPAPPTATLVPTATPEGVVATAKGTVNVRTGPGTVYPVIGQIKKNDQVPLIGASSDFQWYVISFRQQQGWIAASLVSVFGDVRTLPVVAPPPTPTPPPATFTPSPQPFADIVLVSASLNPPTPEPNQNLTLSVIIKNQGALDAGQFAVATSFMPGNVYAAAVVPGLAAGQQTTVTLTAQIPGTGVETIAIVLDLNSNVDEGPAGEANNKPTISYRVDWPRVVQASVNLPPGNSADLSGGTPDVSYDGTKLIPINGAKVGSLPGVTLDQVHYDLLSPDKINNTTGIARADLVQGLVIGIYTAEGKRGAIRVAGYNGDIITLEFFVYDR